MTASTSVKWAVSSMTGAPTLNGTAGSLIAVLDAFLVNGFGTKAVDSAVVTNGICRMAITGGSAAQDHCVIQLAGITGGGATLNGLQRVKTATASYVEFHCDLPDGPLTGTITFKIAPLGWEKVFSATTVAVYRSAVPQSTRMYLRVDDTGTTNARVRAYETMTDATSGVGPVPLESQAAGGLYWPKSNAASATARGWTLVGDDRGFYFAVTPAGGDRYTVFFAGDIASLKSGDAYGYLLTGNQADQSNAESVPDGCVGYSHRSARGGAYLVRAHNGIGQATAAQRVGAHHNGVTADCYAGTAGYSWGVYPNGPNNGLLMAPLELFALGIRGALAGLMHPVQDCGLAFATGATVDGTDDLAGRRLMAVRTGPPASGTTGTVFFDTTGPWER